MRAHPAENGGKIAKCRLLFDVQVTGQNKQPSKGGLEDVISMCTTSQVVVFLTCFFGVVSCCFVLNSLRLGQEVSKLKAGQVKYDPHNDNLTVRDVSGHFSFVLSTIR